MYPLHDKDLDRLSRDAAEHYEVDFGPSGWEQLEKRLDQELPQQRGRRRFLFWLFFIVVTTGSALTGLLINSQPVTPLAASVRAIPPAQHSSGVLNNSTEVPTKTNKAVADNHTTDHSNQTPVTKAVTPPTEGTAEAGNAPLNNKQATTAGAGVESAPAGQLQNRNNNKPVTAGDNTINNNPVNGNTISGANKTGQPQNKPGIRGTSHKSITPNTPITAQPFGLNRQRGQKNNLAKKPTVIHDQPHARSKDVATVPDQIKQDATGTKEQVTTVDEPATITNPPAAAPNTTQINNDLVTEKNKNTDSTATTAPVNKPKKPKLQNDRQRGWEFSVVGGPDKTAIQSGPWAKSGYNVGLQIGYRFGDRWSVNTGIIYTKKFYQADTSQYKPKVPPPPNIKIVGDVDGSCSMLDIPLNIRYDIAYNEKRRIFASTGLSTYIMDKQYYTYDYCYPPSTVTKPHNEEYTKNENYLFSVVNLSIGYERIFSRSFSLQVEPYLKLPSKGLGYGNMRMNSYGIFFSLKYRPGFGSKNATFKR